MKLRCWSFAARDVARSWSPTNRHDQTAKQRRRLLLPSGKASRFLRGIAEPCWRTASWIVSSKLTRAWLLPWERQIRLSLAWFAPVRYENLFPASSWAAAHPNAFLEWEKQTCLAVTNKEKIVSIKNKVVGIIQNKVSRRVAIGSIVGGLGGATLVLAVLRGMFRKPGKDANRHQVIRGGGTVEGTDEGGKGTWTA